MCGRLGFPRLRWGVLEEDEHWHNCGGGAIGAYLVIVAHRIAFTKLCSWVPSW